MNILLIAILATSSIAGPLSAAEDAAGTATVVSRQRGFNTGQLVDWALGPQDAMVDRAFDEMAASGARMHRLGVSWARVQPSGPNEWNWAPFDRVVSAGAARGFKVIINPFGSPNWARKPARRVTDPAKRLREMAYPDDHKAWKAFVRVLARRYAQTAVGFEIWNEENSSGFWDPTPGTRGPNPRLYKTIYCDAAKEIRSIRRGAKVGVGGFAPHGGTTMPNHMRASEFLDRLYAAGIASCGVNFVAYHPYLIRSYCDRKDPPIAKTGGILELKAVRARMVARGRGETPLWNTEWGFPSAPSPAGAGKTCAYDPAWQAAKIREEYLYLRALPYVRYHAYFNAVDSYPDGPIADPFEVIGFLNRDWTRKPSFDVWSKLR